MQVEHVILNLAINARDAMPDGGTLTVSTANKLLDRQAAAALDLPAGDYVAVSVSDTGTGMSEEVMRNAFEPFFTTKPPGKGSGLGLSQVYGVASQSGGGVQIESKLGAGTTVSVLFPRAVPPAASPPDLNRGALTARPVNKPRTVLVVDDDADLRETLQAMLSANSIHAVLAADGAEALRLVDDDQPFDLLLVDFAMPGMNGVELAQHVRARRPVYPWSSSPAVMANGPPKSAGS